MKPTVTATHWVFIVSLGQKQLTNSHFYHKQRCLVTQLTFCLYGFQGNRARRWTESKSNFSGSKTRVLLTLQSQIASQWEFPGISASPLYCVLSTVARAVLSNVWQSCYSSANRAVAPQSTAAYRPYLSWSLVTALILFSYYSFPYSSALTILVLALMYQPCSRLRAFVIALPVAGICLLLIATWLSFQIFV